MTQMQQHYSTLLLHKLFHLPDSAALQSEKTPNSHRFVKNVLVLIKKKTINNAVHALPAGLSCWAALTVIPLCVCVWERVELQSQWERWGARRASPLANWATVKPPIGAQGGESRLKLAQHHLAAAVQQMHVSMHADWALQSSECDCLANREELPGSRAGCGCCWGKMERRGRRGGGRSKDGGRGEQRSYSVLQVRRGGDVLSLRLLLQIHHQDELETKCKFTSDSENLKQRNNKYVFLITE